MSQRSQNKTTLSWEYNPMQLIDLPVSTRIAPLPYTQVAIEITLAYNCLIRALNSVYLQAPHLPLREYSNFSAYSLAVYNGLKAYDPSNEYTFFSDLARETGETSFMKGHLAFGPGLLAWGNWLESIAARRNNFNPEMCRALMDDFLPALHLHMHVVPDCVLYVAQCPLLAFNELSLDVLTLAREHREKVFGSMSKSKLMPVFVMNHDAAFGGHSHKFLNKSALEMWVLRQVYARKYKEWWKFSAVGFDGKPKELTFLRRQ
jgi:hypothetical protein